MPVDHDVKNDGGRAHALPSIVPLLAQRCGKAATMNHQGRSSGFGVILFVRLPASKDAVTACGVDDSSTDTAAQPRGSFTRLPFS